MLERIFFVKNNYVFKTFGGLRKATEKRKFQTVGPVIDTD